MNILLLVVLIHGIVPQPDSIVRDHCEATERNHFYDENGRLVFEQLIYRDQHGEVLAWRLMKSDSQLPRRDWNNGGYVSTWSDNDMLRQVRCNSVYESWLQYDPELAEREHFPQEKRRGLRGGYGSVKVN